MNLSVSTLFPKEAVGIRRASLSKRKRVNQKETYPPKGKNLPFSKSNRLTRLASLYVLSGVTTQIFPEEKVPRFCYYIESPFSSTGENCIHKVNLISTITKKDGEEALLAKKLKHISFKKARQVSRGYEDSFTKYLREVGRKKPLTREREIFLIGKVKEGGKLADSAKKLLWEANLKLVISVAKKYTRYGVHISDLVSEGNLGLREAIEKFDPKKGTRLSTYAVWWIKQHIRKAITENGRVIKIPICQQRTVKKIHEVANRIYEISGYYPSDEEIAQEIGESIQKVRNLRNLTVPMVSLHSFVEGSYSSQKESKTYEEIISDNTGSGESPLQKLGKKNIQESIDFLISKRLNKREQEVIRLRFGLGENLEQNRTLEEVGKIMGLTRERIRQIQDTALKKLRETLKAHESYKPTLLNVLLPKTF